MAASATPHAEILEQAKPLLEEKGYELEVEIFDDYILPNEVVEAGEFDANYFQHIPYLDSFNEEKGTHLVKTQAVSTMSHLEFIREPRTAWMTSKTETLSRFPTTPPTRRERFCFCRTTESSP